MGKRDKAKDHSEKRQKLSISDEKNTGHPLNRKFRTRQRQIDDNMEIWFQKHAAKTQATIDTYKHARRAMGMDAQKARDFALGRVAKLEQEKEKENA